MAHDFEGAGFFAATVAAIGGLLTAAHLYPEAAIPAGALSGALLVGLGRQTSRQVADILGAIMAGLAFLLDRFGWASIVFAPSLALGCLWLRLPERKMESDDRLYIPPLAAALGVGILLLLREVLTGSSENLIVLTGLSGVLEWVRNTANAGAEQLTGDARIQYLTTMETFRRSFPYYYFGGIIVGYSLLTNLTLQLQSRERQPARPFFLFKIKERYIFLLIFAMGLEIFRYIYKPHNLIYISHSFLVFLGITYFIAGLAVLGFLLLMRRVRSSSFLSRWLILVLLFFIIIKPIICAAIGLLDIWFDFRRLKSLRGGNA